MGHLAGPPSGCEARTRTTRAPPDTPGIRPKGLSRPLEAAPSGSTPYLRIQVDDAGVLPALDTRGLSPHVPDGEGPLGSAATHPAAGSVAAGLEGLGVAETADDEALGDGTTP